VTVDSPNSVDFNNCDRPPEGYYTDQGGGNRELSDNPTAVTPSYGKAAHHVLKHLFHDQNVFLGGHLLVLSARFSLGSRLVLAALAHLQNVITVGHSELFLLLGLFDHIKAIFCVCCIQFWISAC